MKKRTFNLITLLVATLCLTLSHSSRSQNKKLYEAINYKDTVMHSRDFITNEEANKILGKPAQLHDSAYKFSSGLLRYKVEYVATYKDSTSKGRIFFMFEQYKDEVITKEIYDNLKTENAKTGVVNDLMNYGNEGFLTKDNLNCPFILIRKGNKLFKFKLYFLDKKISQDELMKVAKKIVASH